MVTLTREKTITRYYLNLPNTPYIHLPYSTHLFYHAVIYNCHSQKHAFFTCRRKVKIWKQRHKFCLFRTLRWRERKEMKRDFYKSQAEQTIDFKSFVLKWKDNLVDHFHSGAAGETDSPSGPLHLSKLPKSHFSFFPISSYTK